MLYVSYVIIGLVGGFIGGFLGLGGGIIFVPFLFIIFNYFNVNVELTIQSAIVTSLTCVVLSSLSALIKHTKNKLVVWKTFYQTLPGIVLGSTLGLILISTIPSVYVKMIYGLLLILIGVYMMRKKNDLSNQRIKNLSNVNIVSVFIGIVSIFLGIGGGTMTTPYFNYHGIEIRKCIATATACGFSLSFLGLLISWFFNSYFINSYYDILKLIVIDAFVLVSISSMISSYYGASLTNNTDVKKIKLIFSYFILITAVFVLLY